MNPEPEQVKDARRIAHMTLREAAAAVGVSLRAWQHWEAGTRRMPVSAWELFQYKYGLRNSAAFEEYRQRVLNRKELIFAGPDPRPSKAESNPVPKQQQQDSDPS
jgi:transcriptional regulator with XRE-family HTH domain